MSDNLLALILTLALAVLLAAWVPILDILQDAVRDLAITKNPGVSKNANTNILSQAPCDHTFDFKIRTVRAAEFAAVGEMLVQSYSSLPGMPRIEDQPEYYQRLSDVWGRANNPSISVLAAVNQCGELLGCVDFIDDMRHYGSGGRAIEAPDAVGVRLLAVKSSWRGRGIGNALTQSCIARARELHKSKVILHSTQSMQVALMMYGKIGFERRPELDFMQGSLEVFGFQLDLPNLV